jgi:hypothetical protein
MLPLELTMPPRRSRSVPDHQAWIVSALVDTLVRSTLDTDGHGLQLPPAPAAPRAPLPIDFCPGKCGSPAEQFVTVPMSRLEASEEVYDVPFLVRFVPESSEAILPLTTRDE